MSLKRPRSHSPSQPIYASTPITDRSSTFTAHFSPTTPPRTLQSLSTLTSASHRILAWRTPSAQRTLGANPRPVLETGCDDDGEKFAGRRVLRVLEEMDVCGAVVVARWYGGVMLGPVRFTHMEDVVRDAVGVWRGAEREEEGKKRRVVEERELVGELRARDESIRVLRGLLEGGKGEGVGEMSKVREVEYEGMELERLRQMDKARDKTIAFLLKRIDEKERQEAVAKAKAKAAEVQIGGEAEVKPLDEEKDEDTIKDAGYQVTADSVQTDGAAEVATLNAEKHEETVKDAANATTAEESTEKANLNREESPPD